MDGYQLDKNESINNSPSEETNQNNSSVNDSLTNNEKSKFTSIISTWYTQKSDEPCVLNNHFKCYQVQMNDSEEVIQNDEPKCKLHSSENLICLQNIFDKYTNDLVPGIYERKHGFKYSIEEFEKRNLKFDLFLWALIKNELQDSQEYWKDLDYHISSAIVAWYLSKKLGQEALKDGKIKKFQGFQEQKRVYKCLAVGVLNELNNLNETKNILIRSISYWNGNSTLEIAFKLNFTTIMKNLNIKILINQVWYDRKYLKFMGFKIVINYPFAFLTTNRLLNKQDNNTISQPDNKETKLSRIISNIKSGFRYYHSPVAKYMSFFLSYIIFLTCYTYMFLVEMRPLMFVGKLTDRAMEFFVYSYFFGFVLEILKEKIKLSRRRKKAKKFLGTIWSINDLITCLAFTVAFICRLIPNLDHIHAKTFFAVALFLFSFRFLKLYYIHHFLGPLVMLIKELISVTLFIVSIYVVAIYSFGSLQQALLYPNSVFNGSVFLNICYNPYFQLYGNIMYDYITGYNNTNTNNLVPAACAMFMIFTNILLLNILIAIFNNKFNSLDIRSQWIQTSKRLISKYKIASIFPPPLNILEFPISSLTMKCFGKYLHSYDFKKIYEVRKYNDISKSEKKCCEAYLDKFKKRKKKCEDVHKKIIELKQKLNQNGSRENRIIQENQSIARIVKKIWKISEKLFKNIKILKENENTVFEEKDTSMFDLEDMLTNDSVSYGSDAVEILFEELLRNLQILMEEVTNLKNELSSIKL